MKKNLSEPFPRVAAFAAALAISACASAKPAAPPSPAKPAHAVSSAPAAAPAPAAMPTGTLTRVGGVVIASDASARTLTIKDYSGRSRSFRIAGGASVTMGGDNAAVGLDALAAGAHVRLKVGGDVVASVHMMVVAAK